MDTALETAARNRLLMLVRTKEELVLKPVQSPKWLQENMGNLDEDTKSSVIESLMPLSFIQGSD